MRDAVVDELLQAAKADPSIVLITGDLGFGVLTKFAETLPTQFVNAGVAEQNMTALACGLAMSGRKVFTYSIANFATLRCLEQIRNDICYHGADVTVISVGGGFSYGQLGMSHFATEDLAILRAIPGMRVVAPTGEWEAREATKALIAHGGPAYLRVDKSLAQTGPGPDEAFAFGKARIVREGNDISLIGTGGIVAEALAAAEILSGEDIEARVIAVHSIKPLDSDTILAAVRETRGLVTVEEHVAAGGLGSAVAELLADTGCWPRAMSRVALPDRFPTVVGDQFYLRQEFGLDAGAVAKAARAVFSRYGE
jgi:transketolase